VGAGAGEGGRGSDEGVRRIGKRVYQGWTKERVIRSIRGGGEGVVIKRKSSEGVGL